MLTWFESSKSFEFLLDYSLAPSSTGSTEDFQRRTSLQNINEAASGDTWYLVFQSHTSAPVFGNVIMPSTPTPQLLTCSYFSISHSCLVCSNGQNFLSAVNNLYYVPVTNSLRRALGGHYLSGKIRHNKQKSLLLLLFLCCNLLLLVDLL